MIDRKKQYLVFYLDIFSKSRSGEVIIFFSFLKSEVYSLQISLRILKAIAWFFYLFLLECSHWAFLPEGEWIIHLACLSLPVIQSHSWMFLTECLRILELIEFYDLGQRVRMSSGMNRKGQRETRVLLQALLYASVKWSQHLEFQ